LEEAVVGRREVMDQMAEERDVVGSCRKE